MLIAILTALFLIFAGESLEFYLTNLKKPVKEHVADDARRDAILAAGKALEKDLKAMEEEIEDGFEELAETHADFESTTEDYLREAAELRGLQQRLSARILDARDEMKKNTTRAEWEAIFSDGE